jgi:hypothetical protein
MSPPRGYCGILLCNGQPVPQRSARHKSTRSAWLKGWLRRSPPKEDHDSEHPKNQTNHIQPQHRYTVPQRNGLMSMTKPELRQLLLSRSRSSGRTRPAARNDVTVSVGRMGTLDQRRRFPQCFRPDQSSTLMATPSTDKTSVPICPRNALTRSSLNLLSSIPIQARNN